MAIELKCQALTAKGKPCASPSRLVDPDTGLCGAHDPAKTERLKEAARKGGNATALRFKPSGLSSDRLGPLETIHDAQRWLRLIAGAVGARQLTHSEGQSMTASVREWVKAESERLKVEDLEELRAQVAELKRLRPA